MSLTSTDIPPDFADAALTGLRHVCDAAGRVADNIAELELESGEDAHGAAEALRSAALSIGHVFAILGVGESPTPDGDTDPNCVDDDAETVA